MSVCNAYHTISLLWFSSESLISLPSVGSLSSSCIIDSPISKLSDIVGSLISDSSFMVFDDIKPETVAF